MLIKIKPLSVNNAWKGRRFKTDDYKFYEYEFLLKLRPLDIPDGKLNIYVMVGFSSLASDCDNILKPLLDILQKKYGFNDNRVYKLTVEKCDIKKGGEFIHFDISKYIQSGKIRRLLSYLNLI